MLDRATPALATRNSGYVPGIHAARAVAVGMVVFAHVVGMWTNEAGFRWFPWQAYLGGVIDPLRIDHQAGGHTGLLLFFLVSGFIVSQAAERDTVGRFLAKRAARLLPAMVLAVALTLLVARLGEAAGWPAVPSLDRDRAFSGHAAVEAVGLGSVFGGISVLFVLWTLTVEYFWYALLAAVLPLTRVRPVAVTCLLVGVVALLAQPVGPLEAGPLHLENSLFSYVLVILVGRWVYLQHAGYLRTPYAAAGGAATIGLYAATRWRYDGDVVLTGPHPRLLALLWATVMLVLLLRFVRSGPPQPLRFLADISYGVYLLHIPVMWTVLPLVSPGGRWFEVGLVLTLGSTLLLAWLSFRFVETPVRRRIRRAMAPESVPG